MSVQQTNGEENEIKLCEMDVYCYVRVKQPNVNLRKESKELSNDSSFKESNNASVNDTKESTNTSEKESKTVIKHEWKNYGGPCYIRLLAQKSAPHQKRLVLRMKGTKRVIWNVSIKDEKTKTAVFLKASNNVQDVGSLLDETEGKDEELMVFLEEFDVVIVCSRKDAAVQFVEMYNKAVIDNKPIVENELDSNESPPKLDSNEEFAPDHS